MFKTIRGKFITSFLVSICICIIIISIIMKITMGNVIKKDFISSTKNEIDKVDKLINTYFKEMYNNCNMLANNSIVKRADSTITKYLEKTGENGKIKVTPIANGGIEAEIHSVYTNFAKSHPNVSDAYLGTIDGGYVQYEDGHVGNNYDPRERPWYKKAMENPGKVAMTDSYYWGGSNRASVSVVSTISNDSNEIIGVQSIDIGLNDLTDIVSKIKIGKNGYILLVEDTGTILSNPKNPNTNFKNISELKIKEMEEIKNGYFEFKDKDEEYVSNVYTSKETGWKFIAIIPKSELLQKNQVVNNLIITLGAVILIISLIISIKMSNGISKPIGDMRSLMSKVEKGDFTVEAKVIGKDEIAQLFESFNKMMGNVKNLIRTSKDISENVTKSTNHISDMSKQVSATADEVVAAISQLSAETYGQTEQSGDIVEAIEGFTEEIEKVTITMDEKSDLAKGLSAEGIEIVNVLDKTTAETSNASNQVSLAIAVLDEKSSHIEDVVNMINRVTDQTSLLALNASIEAARAGEAGKGFGVVASEIAKLAEESKKSTNQIESIVGEIQSEIVESVKAIKKSNELVDNNVKTVGETKVIFNNIAKTINDIKNEVDRINRVVEEMTQKKNEVSQTITNLLLKSEETAASSEEVTAASEEQTSSIHNMTAYIEDLRELADTLRKSISQFNI
ncbi:methyl-accepting chemotaxis protein McpC [Gottschalkia purinilytica]|uniref:Methyl-accepting chemotaxis protein McpC n=1 Tax=Gottschalkia purinilytica TaxID=1503 RepID=A0A0L0W684_GOTPU|nr:methyl-accepting chemotaxis protein [Gottschalkia purinilytica]KNF07029.1 methyl-accepting chemotaxis protein McpC [Gottschalkia purinilytica]